MGRVGLIYQHKGELSVITGNLQDLSDRLVHKSRVYICYRVDQYVDPEVFVKFKKETLERFGDLNLIIIGGDKNIGLSPSRAQCLSYLRCHDIKAFLWCCSNMIWSIDLDDEFLDFVCSAPVIAYPCTYDEDISDRVPFEGDIITFNQWLNNEDRPDMFYSFLTDYYGCFIKGASPKYIPEDIPIYYTKSDIVIYYKAIAKSWYNKDGMSATFNRQTQVENSVAFVERAELFLHEFCNGKLQLTQSRLRGFVNDLVTLSYQVDIKKWEDTIIEPLIMWTLHRWCKNPNHDHCFKFIENG